MARQSFIVISCLVGSSKKTLMCVGHYGGKNFTHFGSSEKFYKSFLGFVFFIFLFFLIEP